MIALHLFSIRCIADKVVMEAEPKTCLLDLSWQRGLIMFAFLRERPIICLPSGSQPGTDSLFGSHARHYCSQPLHSSTDLRSLSASGSCFTLPFDFTYFSGSDTGEIVIKWNVIVFIPFGLLRNWKLRDWFLFQEFPSSFLVELTLYLVFLNFHFIFIWLCFRIWLMNLASGNLL